MKRMMRLAGWFLVLTAAAACSQLGQVGPTPTQQDIATPDVHRPEVTHTQAVTSTVTAIPTPLFTATPTETDLIIMPTKSPDDPLPIAYVDHTADPPAVVLLDPFDGIELQRISAIGLGSGIIGAATLNGFFFIDEDFEHIHRLLLDGSVEVLDFLNPDGGPFQGVVLPSPDGERVAHTVARFDDGGGGHVKLVVFNVDVSGEHILLDEYIATRPVRPTPIKWSADGQHLYYMHVIEGVGGYGGMDLYRIDIQTGISEEIFPNANCLCTTSISPDERYAARVLMDETLRLVIKALESGNEMNLLLPTDYYEAGEMVWAPDSSAVLITVWGFEWVVDAFGILHVDLEEQAVTVLFSDDERFLRPVAWHVMEVIWLNDGEGNLWQMDAESLEMTLTATEAWALSYSQ